MSKTYVKPPEKFGQMSVNERYGYLQRLLGMYKKIGDNVQAGNSLDDTGQLTDDGERAIVKYGKMQTIAKAATTDSDPYVRALGERLYRAIVDRYEGGFDVYRQSIDALPSLDIPVTILFSCEMRPLK